MRIFFFALILFFGMASWSETNLSEDQIPINLEAAKLTQTTESPFLRLIASLSIVGILVAGGVLLVKRKGYKKSLLKENQIKILTQHYLGPKRSLAIVRVAGESILIGITDQAISHIKTLSLLDDEIPESPPKEFDGLIKEEDFSMKGIKDIVGHKMKNMRSL
ncbi:MAG: flagellar biosynthetic protein FliO [Bdellovibrionaceae bacterium]|nr:flagellar biosynthetic protein FliO [Pseudobdellovibrionaceae bacterium]